MCRFCSERGVDPEQAVDSQIVMQHLDGWHAWASQTPNLDSSAHAMSYGPEMVPVYCCDRARVGGVDFACARMQSNTKAKTCTVVVKDTDEDGIEQVRVGQIRSFFDWSPPWETGRARAVLEVADVQWYESMGVDDDLGGTPVVKRAFAGYSCPGGNLILAREILPMHVCLVPHLENQAWWQVLYLGGQHALAQLQRMMAEGLFR